jgi:hypothetical protein
VAGVLDDLQARIDDLPPKYAKRRVFLAAYLRTTAAVGRAVERARFEDPAWVERWDVAFAGLSIAAHDADLAGRPVPRPWELAFGAPPELSDLRHVLLGINAHLNYDLPQAMLAVISQADFEDPVLMARRLRDHERIDAVLAGQVSSEDSALDPESLVYRLLTPANRLSTRRFLKEARHKVWHNTYELNEARSVGPETYRERLAELEVLSAAKIADLLAPGQVVLRLAVAGFGVTLPPPGGQLASRRPPRAPSRAQ